jgi:hypothetical protein
VDQIFIEPMKRIRLMNLKKVFSILSVGALGVAAVLGVIAYRTASAQEATPTAPSTTEPSTTVPGGKGFVRTGFGRGFEGLQQ